MGVRKYSFSHGSFTDSLHASSVNMFTDSLHASSVNMFTDSLHASSVNMFTDSLHASSVNMFKNRIEKYLVRAGYALLHVGLSDCGVIGPRISNPAFYLRTVDGHVFIFPVCFNIFIYIPVPISL